MCVYKLIVFLCAAFSISAAVKSHVVGLWTEAACVCRPCGHTPGFGGRSRGGEAKEAKEREVGGRGVEVAPGSSYFPSWGPAEVRRVTERELVSLSVLHAP